jgi:hypothetical protein
MVFKVWQQIKSLGKRSTKMAANREQGSYLAEFILGFTSFPAGLVVLFSYSQHAIGSLVTIAGLGLLVHSAMGFLRIKTVEFSNRR